MIEKRNLVFFCTRGKQADDFREVSRKIRSRANDVVPWVFTTRAAVRPILAASLLIQRPTVSIEMDWRRHRPRILRGRRLTHGGVGSKIEQSKQIDACGLPLPQWTEVTPDTSLDPAEWGPYVVVKPSRGARGAYVWIHKTGRVRFRSPSDYPEDHPGRRGPMIAQRFIYTGPWPICYRVLTYFGVPIMAIRYEGRHDLPPLDGPDGVRRAGGGLSIVATAKGCKIALTHESDVLDLAARTHGAFQTIPSLGTDIVREAGTGKLYLVEVNGGGNSWLLTSDAGVEMQAEFGLDFYREFNALDLIADRTIEIARQYAR